MASFHTKKGMRRDSSAFAKPKCVFLTDKTYQTTVTDIKENVQQRAGLF